MRKVPCLISVSLLFAVASSADFGDMVSSWRAPGQCSPRYCHGLAWDGKYIWCFVDNGEEPSYFYRCRRADGSVISSFPTNLYDFREGNGVCCRTIGGTKYLDTSVMIYDEHSSECYYWLYRYDFNGSLVKSIRSGVSQCWGIYYDGSNYWKTLRGEYSKVYKLSPTLSPISSFRVLKRGWATGVCKQGKFFWFSVGNYYHGAFKTLDNGSVVASFPTPIHQGQMYDCTFDGKYLWMVSAENVVTSWDVSNAPAVEPSSFGKVKALFR
jgi:hypothetical protein